MLWVDEDGPANGGAAEGDIGRQRANDQTAGSDVAGRERNLDHGGAAEGDTARRSISERPVDIDLLGDERDR